MFPVQWLVDTASAGNVGMVKATRESIDFYLCELHEQDAWGYAKYHCSTYANMAGWVHWSHFLIGQKGSRISSRIVQLSEAEAEKLFGADLPPRQA